MGMKYLIVVLTYLFLMASDVEHQVLIGHLYLLWRNVYKFSDLFFYTVKSAVNPIQCVLNFSATVVSFPKTKLGSLKNFIMSLTCSSTT